VTPITLPYGRHDISAQDIEAVVEVLCSDWLTTGPMVEAFEKAVVDFVGVRDAAAVSTGTAALHAMIHALGIGPGDEVIVPPLTFAATANAVVYTGATPVFADVCPDTLLLDPEQVVRLITARTKAVVAMDYGGQPCDYWQLQAIAERSGIVLLADACHSMGATFEQKRCGSVAFASAFSFHPVKAITCGEGGMVCSDDADFIRRVKRFRNHGLDRDHRQRSREQSWHYEMVELGFNYRLSDLQCALGLSQIRRLPEWLDKRRQLAAHYDHLLADVELIRPLSRADNVEHAYHLYVVRVAGQKRDELFTALRENGVGVAVHYPPVHLHPFYKDRYHTREGMCPVAENAYQEIISLPIYPAMTFDDVGRVVDILLHHAR